MNPFDTGPARRSNSRRLNSGLTPSRAPRPEGEAASDITPGGWADIAGGSDSEYWLRCDVVALDVVAYFDSEADDEAALRARRHLDSCVDCARMWRDWGDTRLLLRTARLPEMPVQWPASLVQRARLHALLPALFVNQDAATDAPDDPGLAPDEVRPPRELRQAILARTTQAAQECLCDAVAEANLEAREVADSGPEILDRSGGLLGVRRYRTATRACASALAAWMLTLASFPSPEPTAQSGQETPPQTQLKPTIESPRHLVPVSRAALASPRLAAAPRRAKAAAVGSKAALETRPATLEGDEAALPTPGAIDSASLEAASPTPVVAPPSQRSDVGGASASLTQGADEATYSTRLPRGSLLPVRVASPPAPEAQDLRRLASRAPAPVRTASPERAPKMRLALAVAPRNQSSRNVAIPLVASATQGVKRANRGGEDAARTSGPASHAWPAAESAQHDSAEWGIWEAAEHEPLTLSRELNDTRPAELSDAIDAYAATWVDEDESAL